MSDKKKKKKKGEKTSQQGPGAESTLPQLDGVDSRTLEYYEAKIKDMAEKIDRMKLKCDNLVKENEILAKAQTKFNHDKQDIVEFLNIKVGEHEKIIANLETKTRQLEDEKRDLDTRSRNEIETIKSSMQSDLEIMQIQCAKYKAELSELTAFSAKKEEMEQQIKQYRVLLDKKESEYRDTIHNLERKVLQDKTTKRAIRENMAITSQLKKMSSKTIELIAENDTLSAKVAKLKTSNTLLTESEQELAKRNQANQRVIKMLVEKLKESDQMLELAFESEQLGQGQGTGGENGNNATGEFLTDEMREEIEALQYDYNVLAARLTEVANVADEMELVFEDSFADVQDDAGYDNMTSETLAYLRTNLATMIDRLKTLTWFESSEEGSQELNPEFADQNAESAESDQYGAESAPYAQDGEFGSPGDGYDDGMDDVMQQGSLDGSGIQLIVPDIRMPENQVTQQHPEPREGEQIDEYSTQEYSEQDDRIAQNDLPSNSQSGSGSIRNDGVNDSQTSFPLTYMTSHQQRVEHNFAAVVSAIPSKHKTIASPRIHDSCRDIGVQTNPLPFGEATSAQYLLGELRPWGAQAAWLLRLCVEMIKAVLVFNNQGKPRLMSWYQQMDVARQQSLLKEVHRLVNKRPDSVCNFLEGGALVGDDTRIIYRVSILDLIQVFVEALDRTFVNVCELDLIFRPEDVMQILGEIISGGLVLETNIHEIIAASHLRKSSATHRQVYVGAKISLISKSNLRFVGTLHSINQEESSVALEQVRSYGTEGRMGNPSDEIEPVDQIFPFIVFKGSDVKDLHIINHPPPPPPVMPPAGVASSDPLALPSKPAAKSDGRADGKRPQTAGGQPQDAAGQPAQPRGQRIVIPDSEFDFESANAKFDKSNVEQEQLHSGESSDDPVFYSKSNFFDNISCDSRDRAEGESGRGRRDNRSDAAAGAPAAL
nr:hypothetical protein HK105_001667 [Polyrhizophydium stewartii]